MQNTTLSNFSTNYKEILIDEIALEGLEGIGIDLLWRRVEARMSSVITEKMRIRLWSYLTRMNDISFYLLPEPVPRFEILDRFSNVDLETGHIKDPDDYIDGPYEYCPLPNEYGSCRYYATRVLLTSEDLQPLSYHAMLLHYGDNLVIVASLEERWRALADHLPFTSLSQIPSTVHFCILELIGKGRENGQMTYGRTNLAKVVKDSKLLFYNRKYLQDLDLVRVTQLTQITGGKGSKSLMLRLKRFHKPKVLSIPRVGMIHELVNHLLEKPDYSERTDLLIKNRILTSKLNKKLHKNISIFNFDERIITISDSKTNQQKQMKKKFIMLPMESDESSASDEENDEVPLKCRYHVGVNMLRQAYERFLEAGLKGLTQLQLAQLLGIEFYTSRSICRVFKTKKIVREYLEDKGKQRTARYIAVVATAKVDVRYEEETKKLLEYLDVSNIPSTSTDITNEVPLKTENEAEVVPKKKRKLEAVSSDIQAIDTATSSENVITEVKFIDGCEGLKLSKKPPTLRQLKYANGIMKVLQQRLCISNYQLLTTLASKECNEPPMDTKALKSFIQRLSNFGYIKIYKMKWPAIQKFSVLVCANHVKITDPIIKAKYKELCMRAATNKNIKIKKEFKDNTVRPIVNYTYPRFMKIQKLHDFLVKFAYFETIQFPTLAMPQGFLSLVDVMAEMTLEFLINNISNMGRSEINQMSITDAQLKLKLRDAPLHIYNVLIQSNILHNTLRTNIKMLAMLGLVQLIRKEPNIPSSITTKAGFVFYVNRTAKILNTTGEWPRPYTSDIEQSYYINSPEDVANFWEEVYEISINTIINGPRQPKKKLEPPIRVQQDVDLYDRGERFGDGNGPCGYDSCFYMDIPRLWRTFFMRRITSIIKERKKIIKKPKFEIKKKIKPKAKPKPKRKPAPNPAIEKLPPVKLTRKRPASSLVKWSKREDMIITMCKAAITIMSPTSQPGSMMVRNMVAKDLLSLDDPLKTKSVCHTRASMLNSNLSLKFEKQCILNELRKRRDLILQYEGLLKKLRLKFPANLNKLVNKSRLPMLELVWIISQIMQSRSYTARTPCVALNLEQFHKHFTIVSSTANKECNLYKIPEHAALKEAIMLSIMIRFQNELTNEMATKIYKIFSEFPDKDLRVAIDHLRKATVIAANDKYLNNGQSQILDLEDIAHASYKLSAAYRRAWMPRINTEFCDKLAVGLSEEYENDEFKGSPQINCILCEMQASGVIELVSATIPVLTDSSGRTALRNEHVCASFIETTYRLKTGTVTFKNKLNIKRFSEVYDDMDIPKILEDHSRLTVINVCEDQTTHIDMNDKIISHLKEKAEEGATFSELRDLLSYNNKHLLEKLNELEAKGIAKRVGFDRNILVLTQHIQPWTIKMDDKNIMPYPWLNLDGSIRYNMYIIWAGAVLNKICDMPGCSLAFLSEKCEYLTTRSVQDLCEFLQTLGCVELYNVQNKKPDLFSDVDITPEFGAFNQYESPENIFVTTTKNCLTKYAYVRKKLLE